MIGSAQNYKNFRKFSSITDLLWTIKFISKDTPLFNEKLCNFIICIVFVLSTYDVIFSQTLTQWLYICVYSLNYSDTPSLKSSSLRYQWNILSNGPCEIRLKR